MRINIIFRICQGNVCIDEIKFRKKLTDLKNKYESLEIPLQTKVIADAKGSLVDNILKFAEDEKVDLIVIANIGLGGFSKFKALGSVQGVSQKRLCVLF
jgi:hypothetical protein